MRAFSQPEHQAAGHDGCLTLEDGSLFVKLATPQEIRFYNEIDTFDNAKDDEGMGSRLTDWIPVYLGTLTEGEMNSEANSVKVESVTQESITKEPETNEPETEEPVTKEPQTQHSITKESPTKKSITNQVPPKTTDKEYIVLENLYHRFNRPSVLDIKLGSKLTDDETTTKEKIERLDKVSRTTTSGSLGFRICGMKSFVGETDPVQPPELFENMNNLAVSSSGPYLEFNKLYGRNLNTKIVSDAILYYFTSYFNQLSNGKLMVTRLLETFLKRLQLLYNCLLDYEIRIFSGSLLFLFENDITRWDPEALLDDDLYDQANPLIANTVLDSDDDEDEEYDVPPPLSKLNLIDFGHAKFVKGQGCDDNILTGLENLMEIFESLLQREKEK
jgi:1D-myo-inositol-tetrakisphosphate 5-kinase/inositol-polyphosphate multikinase